MIGAPIYSLSWKNDGEVVQIKLLVVLKQEISKNIISRIEQQIIQELRQVNQPLARCMDLGTAQLRVLFDANPESIDDALDIWM